MNAREQERVFKRFSVARKFYCYLTAMLLCFACLPYEESMRKKSK